MWFEYFDVPLQCQGRTQWSMPPAPGWSLNPAGACPKRYAQDCTPVAWLFRGNKADTVQLTHPTLKQETKKLMCTLNDFCHWFSAKKDWCCCLALIVITVIFTIFFVEIGLLDSFWNLIIWFVDVIIHEGVASWITAIATSFAACFAYRAFRQSQKARKSAAFSTLFAQLIDNHKSIFGNKESSKSSFVSLVNHFKDKIDSMKSESIGSDFVEEMYNEGLGDDTYFSHCFKYVYYEIKTVLDERSLEDNERMHYMGVIQACMNYDELFAYFINLLQHFSKDYLKKKGKCTFQRNRFNKRDNDFMAGLLRYGFFNNLSEGHGETYIKQLQILYRNSSEDSKKIIRKIIDKNKFGL